MKVICKKTTAKGLDLKEVTTLLQNEYNYGLTIGKEYLVMGIVMYKDSNCLYYLVDENEKPNWVPYLLFEIVDNSLPKNWHAAVFPKDSSGDIFYLCGFDELCNNDDYYDELTARDKKALQTYFNNKNILENGANPDCRICEI